METIHRVNSVEKPKLIAHRGFAVGIPQNSLPAFEAAGKLGFWAIETDVRKSADGVLMCCHDATVDSMFRGSGAVEAMTYDQLKRLEFKEEKSNGCLFSGAMPSFDEYLSLCKAYGSIPFIETKTSDISDVLEAALRLFREEEIVISSVQMQHLEIVRQITDRVFIHHIFSDEQTLLRLQELGNSGLSYNYPDYRLCPVDLINKTHTAGVQICLRAGDTVAAVRDMITLGLDYIPTNCIASI